MPSFAKRISETKATSEGHKYLTIGLGSCGTVFEVPGSDTAIKKGADVDAIWRDFVYKNRVNLAIAEVETSGRLSGEYAAKDS